MTCCYLNVQFQGQSVNMITTSMIGCLLIRINSLITWQFGAVKTVVKLVLKCHALLQESVAYGMFLTH